MYFLEIICDRVYTYLSRPSNTSVCTLSFISLHDEQDLFFAAQLCICVQSWSIISIKFPGNTLNSTISMSANQLCPCQVLFSLLLITSMLTADILLVGVVFSFLVDCNSSMQICCVNLMSVMYALFFSVCG